MNILFVSSECTPFMKTGGLADVIGTLPKTLSSKVSCSVVIPYYKKIKDFNDCLYVGYTYFSFGDRLVYCGLFKKQIDNVTYFFIDNNDYFYHDKIYGLNDGERFAFFNIALLETLHLMGEFDVLHLNDWHTGLIPFLNEKKYKHNFKSIFTIHNIQYQGIFDKELSNLFYFYDNTIEFDNKINFMKSGIVCSNVVTTVSKTYRDETLTCEYSYYLENILKDKIDNYIGVINGIDTSLFNPLTDKNIYKQYDINSIWNKKYNKEKFCGDYHLNNNMLCGLVSRLCEQKGIELIIDSLDELINNTNMNFFLMGSGDTYYENKLKEYSCKYPNRVKSYIGYNDSLAMKVYSSCDVLLVPSKFEPCGLSQLIAMRYGTLPLVRETGGLKDTVHPYNKFDKSGVGFSFKNFNINDFKEVMYIAHQTFYTSDWDTLIKNAMKQDFSFEYSSNEYLNLYKRG
ncbi:MAG: glycogen/starch synthase [bacterium]